MNELDHEALWLKAKLFINLAMDDVDWRSFDEQGLWASLSLEILAKAALSRTSPLLIIAATDDANSNLAAVGLAEPKGDATTIPANRLWDRCQLVFKPFNASQALLISKARNAYIHSSKPSLFAIPPEVWWPRFWAQASILVQAMDKSIVDFVGISRAAGVERHLAQNKLNVQHRYQMLIEHARRRLKQHAAGTLPARVQKEFDRPAFLSAGMTYSTVVECPACGSSGELEGEDEVNVEIVMDVEPGDAWDTDDYSAWVTVAPEYFSCSTCHLVLEDFELLQEGDLNEDFETLGDLDQLREPEYDNE